MDILDNYIIYHFNRCLIFMGMNDLTGDPYPHGYGYEGKFIRTSVYG
jgi:hypothetical protein